MQHILSAVANNCASAIRSALLERGSPQISVCAKLAPVVPTDTFLHCPSELVVLHSRMLLSHSLCQKSQQAGPASGLVTFESDEATEYLQLYEVATDEKYLDQLSTCRTYLLGHVHAFNKDQLTLEKETRKIISALRDDLGRSKEHVELMTRLLQEDANMDEQEYFLLHVLKKKKRHLYQLIDRETLFQIQGESGARVGW
mmetsp:Transcript_604/g.2154  ORF Transcript_604/g.2154 Transcript_604/m.2154 type:complete len:200 (-) Transcript_604:98-697(-)